MLRIKEIVVVSPHWFIFWVCYSIAFPKVVIFLPPILNS